MIYIESSQTTNTRHDHPGCCRQLAPSRCVWGRGENPVSGRKWRYIRYNPADQIYFGCDEVVREEWNYIRSRRRKQGKEARERGDADAEGFVALVSPERDGPRGPWHTVVRLFSFGRRTRSREGSPFRESRAAEEGPEELDKPPADLTGIALSGGGIRSASFCLGVLQALSYAGWLKKLDYLSTVSGGGYIGGSLAWLLHRKWSDAAGREIPYGLDRGNFPYGSYPMVGMSEERWDAQEGEGEADSSWHVYKGRMLMYLRQHASYLTPGNGINIMSLLAVAVRNSLFSIFVYGGLLIVLFALAGYLPFGPAMDWSLYRYYDRCIPWPGAGVNAAYGLASMLGLVFLFLAILYSVVTLFRRKTSTGYAWRLRFERGAGRLLLALAGLVVIGTLPHIYDWIDEAGRTPIASSSFKISGEINPQGETSFAAKIEQPKQAGAIQTQKWRVSSLGDKLAAILGALSTLLGAISAALAFVMGGKAKRKLPTGLLVAVGSIGLVFGLLVLAYHFSAWLRVPSGIPASDELWLRPLPLDDARMLNDYVVMGLACFLLFFLRFSNLNYLSLHRYYRDRLMETFMPDLPDALDVNGPLPGGVKSADETPLSKIADENAETEDPGPYPIINTNIVLVSSQIPKFRGRGGDNFILTPKHCGSNATGWCDTKDPDSPFSDMTLPTAIAISGAAIDSNTGSGGEGITRSPWLSFLMGFFNIGLGYWAENPTPPKERIDRIVENLGRQLPKASAADGEQTGFALVWAIPQALFTVVRGLLNQLILVFLRLSPLWCFQNVPTALYPGFSELYLRKNLDENSRMVQLSDGGHFENLGLYELIRRRLRLIIVCDGSADPDFAFDDLGNAMERVRSDFGALIDIDCTNCESLTPATNGKSDSEGRMSYAKKGYLRADITYTDGSHGSLIYITANFFKDLYADLYAYRKSHVKFPDQPTSNQFFDEKEFEAYRELGYQTAYHMLCDKDIVSHPDARDTLGEPGVNCRQKSGI
jgi:hypothetical protein